MQKIKLTAFAFVLAAAGLSASADTTYLHIQTADGNWKVLDIEQIDKLEFKNGVMTASDATGKTIETVKQTDLAGLQFNDKKDEVYDYSAAVDVTAAGEGFSLNGRTVAFGVSGTLTVLDTKGAVLASIPGYAAGQVVDLSALPSGIVILNIDGKSYKAVLK